MLQFFHFATIEITKTNERSKESITSHSKYSKQCNTLLDVYSRKTQAQHRRLELILIEFEFDTETNIIIDTSDTMKNEFKFGKEKTDRREN